MAASHVQIPEYSEQVIPGHLPRTHPHPVCLGLVEGAGEEPPVGSIVDEEWRVWLVSRLYPSGLGKYTVLTSNQVAGVRGTEESDEMPGCSAVTPGSIGRPSNNKIPCHLQQLPDETIRSCPSKDQ